MDAQVRKAEDQSRYELVVNGTVVAIADYQVTDGVVVLPHTEVLRHLRGQGMAAKLVQGALDDVRAQGKLVTPACWYVREFIDENEGYADLVA